MSRQLSRPEACEAVLSWRYLHDLAHALPSQRAGRPRQHPLALHLAWAALARVHGSGNRLDVETRDRSTWRRYVDIYNRGARAHPRGQPVDRWCDRLTSDTYRHTRELLCADENLAALRDWFTVCSIEQAQELGLIAHRAGGSLTRPSPLRVVYGDGTVVRPMYKNREANGRRIDTDADEHTRHDGTIIGNNIVFAAARGPEHNRRVILAVTRVGEPGQEAATALELISNVVAVADGGVQAVVYDGAFRGSHHHSLMDRHGVVVINKVHPATRTGNERTYRTVALGAWTRFALIDWPALRGTLRPVQTLTPTDAGGDAR